MDPIVQAELERLEDSIPFRAVTGHRHQTWARTFVSRPQLYLRPRSAAEIQKIVTLARRCRQRLTVVGSGHSPSDLSCTSSWLINLDDFSAVIAIDPPAHVIVIQSGIRLRDLGTELQKHGLAMPNLGSIDEQSIAGAIGTGTHGSSLSHGILSQSVIGLRIMLANGRTVSCTAQQNPELFRAALVSLGALGIITEITFRAVPAFHIEWNQRIQPLDQVLTEWRTGLWTQAEYTRVWWLPYGKRAVVWRAEKTSKSVSTLPRTWYGGKIGFHTYQSLLYVAQWAPRLLPWIEWFVFGMQYGFRDGHVASAVEDGHKGLLMDCLYSQFVNEWAIPLEKGPEALTRLSAWLNGDEQTAKIPVSSRGVFVHAPIEVRVTDSTATAPRPYLDNTATNGPTLYLNATLYRPYHADPPCRLPYYAAFEHLMKELGGRPHWAKNFLTVSHADLMHMYGDRLEDWLRVRDDADPDGMFVGDWHRRYLLADDEGHRLPLEEKIVAITEQEEGGLLVEGARARDGMGLSMLGSEESFDLMHGGEAQASAILDYL
ncbi:MAG: D-arabinono-1,4-lactone oxidase [Thelocarpon superellum]|nr:MAG: D-arabinono-1,4-lactone oxidase [Thelocarpon superellum]